MDNIKKIPVWVVIILLILMGAISALWFMGQRLAAVLAIVLLACVTTGIVVSWWSANLLREGARIALFAQKSDDDRDVQLLRTVADMGKMWRQVQNELPALPMPDQQSVNWRCDYDEGDYTEVN